MSDISYTVKNPHSTKKITISEIEETNIVRKEKSIYHLIEENQSALGQIANSDHKSKNYTVKINGNKYDIDIQDEYDVMIEKMGMNASEDQKVTDIKAPMPGLILDIMVKGGDTIQKGDAIIILEAMKMENVIKAGGEGIVKKIFSKKGDAVDKGQIIIEMEK